jgi:hypothetical protein
VPVQPFPIAANAPARAKPGHERVPATRLHAERYLVADRAAIPIREDEEEHDRGHDNSQHEEADEDDNEYHGRQIRGQVLERLTAP